MELSDAFAPEVTIDSFFRDILPELHRSRRDDFEKMSSIPIRVCVKFDDDRVYTVEASASKIEIEEDEAIDFPIATVFGSASDWDHFKTWVLRYADVYESRKSELQSVFQFTQKYADALEKYDVVIDAKFVNQQGDAIACSVVLNDYEASSSFKKFAVEIGMDVADDVANGAITPATAAKGLKVSGDYAIAAELGALAMKFKP